MNLSRKKSTEKNYSWVWKGALALAMVLLIVCFFTEKDPKSVLSDVVQYALGNKDKISKNDKQWVIFLDKKQSQIDSLNSVIEGYRKRTIPDSAKVKTTSTGLNLRALPSTDSDVIAKIPDGSMVKLYYKDNEVTDVGGSQGSWVKVSYEGAIGFVFSTYLDL